MLRITPFAFAFVIALFIITATNSAHAQLLSQQQTQAGGLSGGFGFAGGGLSGSLNFNFSQSSSRTSGTTSAGVTTLDGYPGSFQSGTIRPFVTGVTPVVSNFQRRIQAQAAIGQHQLAELRQSQANLADQRLQSHLSRATSAEKDGDYRMAIANYKRAIGIAGNPLRFRLEQRITDLKERMREERKQDAELRRDAAKKKQSPTTDD